MNVEEWEEGGGVSGLSTRFDLATVRLFVGVLWCLRLPGVQRGASVWCDKDRRGAGCCDRESAEAGSLSLWGRLAAGTKLGQLARAGSLRSWAGD